MIIKENQPITAVSWLKTLNGGGYIKKLYEPESIEELQMLCRDLYCNNQKFDLIGHASNTLYTPEYVCNCMVSTRKLNAFEIREDEIVCQCGVSVRKLSLAAVDAGIKGFEGLIDLPGTVASAIYGHATCYGCDISNLLIEAKVLTSEGEVETVTSEWFGFEKKTSSLKRGEKRAVILTVKLRREIGNTEELKNIAALNHRSRQETQPEAKNSLGSIFIDNGRPTMLNRALSVVIKPYTLILKVKGYTPKQILDKRKKLIFYLLGAKDVEPYVSHWNWYQWTDARSYNLFWKFVRLHHRLFSKSEFEIEIKRQD